jgi:hypothetical protein
MIVHGLTGNAADAPGQEVSIAKMSRKSYASGGVTTGPEDWEFVAETGERMEVHVEYERALERFPAKRYACAGLTAEWGLKAISP